jgi:hypothetical protein
MGSCSSCAYLQHPADMPEAEYIVTVGGSRQQLRLGCQEYFYTRLRHRLADVAAHICRQDKDEGCACEFVACVRCQPGSLHALVLC